MIDVFKQPVTVKIPTESVSFTINQVVQSKYGKSRYLQYSDDSLSSAMLRVSTKLSTDIIKSSVLTEGASVLMSLGEDRDVQLAKTILWGSQIPFSMSSEGVEVLALTGPESYANMGLKPGLFFDSRWLIPWAFGVSRQKPVHGFSLIPGPDNMQFVEVADTFKKNGIHVINPTSPIVSLLDSLSRSRVALCGSISAYAISEAIGVRSILFHTANNYDIMKSLSKDYFEGTNRKEPELMDFSRNIAVTSKDTDNLSVEDFKYMLHKFLYVSPFNLRQGVEESIMGYFDEIS